MRSPEPSPSPIIQQELEHFQVNSVVVRFKSKHFLTAPSETIVAKRQSLIVTFLRPVLHERVPAAVNKSNQLYFWFVKAGDHLKAFHCGNKIIIINNPVLGDELFTDSYEVKLVDDVLYEVIGKVRWTLS